MSLTPECRAVGLYREIRRLQVLRPLPREAEEMIAEAIRSAENDVLEDLASQFEALDLEYPPKGFTMTGRYAARLIRSLKTEVKR
jgi:hypothetical protein